MMKDEHNKKIHFKIDKSQYTISEEQNPVTGEYLRSLPPVLPDYDLWKREEGNKDDKLITPGTSITVKNGDHFFTSKRIITPGGKIQ